MEIMSRCRRFGQSIQKLIVVLFLPAASLGTYGQTAAPTLRLSEAAQRVFVRLNDIAAGFPDGEWRSHDGGLPHGEGPALDDSVWPVHGGNYSLPPNAVWLRCTLPKTLDGYSFRSFLTGMCSRN
jgi:hypothetical protein